MKDITMSNDFFLPPPKPVVGSDEQKAIWSATASISKADNPHILVDALAGSGKTFTCERAQRRLTGRRNAMVCFGAAVEEEYKARNPGLTAMTFHKLGKRMLEQNLSHRPRIDRDKSDGILNDMGPDYGFRKYWPRGLRWAVSSMADKLKQNGFLLRGMSPGSIPAESLSVMERIRLHHDILPNYPVGEFYQLVVDYLIRCKSDTTTIDFGDMVWLPIELNLHAEPFDDLFIDESQDLNFIQQELAFRMGRRLIFVGDTHQAIFGFRGADSRSMATIWDRINLERPALRFPLTVCRRCPVDVLTLAQQIVPDIKPLDDAIKGEVVIDPNPLANVKPSDLLICRVNAPLLRTLYAFWKERTDAYMVGRDVADGLVSLMRRLEPTSIPDLHNKLDLFQSEEEGRITQRQRGVESALATLRDKCDCLRVLAEEEKSVADVDACIKRIQAGARTPTSIRLSSIHRIKGSEAKRVHILHPEFLPHAMATQDWEKEQEANLAYVAVTRSQEYLSFGGMLPGYFDKPEVRKIIKSLSFQETSLAPEIDEELEIDRFTGSYIDPEEFPEDPPSGFTGKSQKKKPTKGKAKPPRKSKR